MQELPAKDFPRSPRKQQEAVAEFRRILQKEEAPGMTFRDVLDEFMVSIPSCSLADWNVRVWPGEQS